MAVSHIPGDVKRLLNGHEVLLKQLFQESREAWLIKEQIIDFANDRELSPEVVLSPEDRNVYSETLVSMLVQYRTLQNPCETCAKLYERKRVEIESAARKIKDAGDGLKWMFTSKAKKEAALQAYQSLKDDLHGDYASLINQLSARMAQIKNSSADTNWGFFCKHSEDIIQIFDLLCPGVRKPYNSGYSFGAGEIAHPYYTIDRQPENPGYSHQETTWADGSKTAEDRSSQAPDYDVSVSSASITESTPAQVTYDAPISGNTYEVARIPVLNSAHAVCPFCNQIMTTRAHVKYPSYKKDGQTTRKYAVLWECSQCIAVYADNYQLSELVEWNKGASFKTAYPVEYPNAREFMVAVCGIYSGPLLTEDDMPYRNWGKHKDNLSESGRIIRVYSNKCQCRKCQKKFQVNTVVNRTAVVETVSGGTVKINVMFCRGCGQYFVSLVTLKHHKELYEGLLMECRTDSDIDANKLNWFNFAPDTVLSRCGYTVKEGVSQEYRHAILSYLLDSGRADKGEIIENINNSIQIRKNQDRYKGACSRWEDDIKFVSEYKINRQRFVYGLKPQSQ